METEYKYHTEEINKAADFFQTLLNKYNQEKIISSSQKEDIAKLNQQLRNKYSTETHVLVEREVLEGLSVDFDELADGFGQLRDTFDTIYDYASDISSEADYHDARSFRDTAIDCMEIIENILDPKPEEEPVKKTPAKKITNNEGNE